MTCNPYLTFCVLMKRKGHSHKNSRPKQGNKLYIKKRGSQKKIK